MAIVQVPVPELHAVTVLAMKHVALLRVMAQVHLAAVLRAALALAMRHAALHLVTVLHVQVLHVQAPLVLVLRAQVQARLIRALHALPALVQVLSAVRPVVLRKAGVTATATVTSGKHCYRSISLKHEVELIRQ